MLKKWIALLLSSCVILSACHSPVYNQTMSNVADVKLRAQAARHKSDVDARPAPSLLVKEGPYVDTTPISLSHDPAWARNSITIRGDQLPFSYYSRTVAAGAGGNVLTKYQPGLDPSQTLGMNYSGSIKGALDVLAAKSGYVYTLHDNSIYWQAFITKTLDVAFMPGSSDYLMGKKNNSGASTASQSSGGQVQNFVSSDSSDSEYSNLSGKLSIWDDLSVSLKSLLSKEGQVTVSQATTSVTVRDRPANVELVERYVHNLNNNLAKQVLVKIQVIEVNLENDFQYGINWQVIANAFHNSPFVINGNYGTPVAITSFTTQPSVGGVLLPAPQFGFNSAQDPNNPNGVPSYTILMNALNQQGHAAIVSEPRVVCLNNQVSVVRIVSQNGYLASIQNTTLASGGTAPTSTVTSQVTPGNLITGLTLYILPKVLDENVFLQVNADLSTNDGFSTVAAAGTTIQLPNITEKHFNQRSRIKSGDTLILSGLRQTTNRANANQFIYSQALGGKGSQQLNKETIVLITPIILKGSA